MTGGHDAYFGLLKLACDGLAGHSDSFVADAFARYRNTFGLLDLKSRGEGAIRADARTKLPMRNDVFRMQADLTGASPPVTKPAGDMAEEFIDIMLRRKQVPSALEIELMARSLYAEQVLAMRSSGERSSFVGATVEQTLARKSNDNWGSRFGWDHWDLDSGESATFEACFAGDAAGGRQSESQVISSLLKITSNAALKTPDGEHQSLLRAAVELDETIQNARIKLLRRLVLSKLHTPLLSGDQDDLATRLNEVCGQEDAWALEFEVHALKSVGTVARVNSGLLSSSSSMVEQFYVDERDVSCKLLGCSYIERHLLLPHCAYAAISDLPSTKGKLIHVLADGVLTENV